MVHVSMGISEVSMHEESFSKKGNNNLRFPHGVLAEPRHEVTFTALTHPPSLLRSSGG